MRDDVERRSQHHCRNAVGFEMPCNQTHGLVAHGSQGDQQCNVCIVLTQASQHLRRIVFGCSPLTV